MKKIILGAIAMITSISLWAVPAYHGWQTRTQSDGSQVTIRQVGDEFHHYYLNEAGQQVRENAQGYWEVVGEAPTAEAVKARRAAVKAHRTKQDVGTTPYLAPRGLLILVNFSDTQYKSTNTYEVMDSLVNAMDCQVNKDGNTKYPSAAQYFRDQSRGAYAPMFDVFGPVTLSKNSAYYGTNYNERKQKDNDGEYEYAADAIVEACKLANEQHYINFSDYDWNNDGEIDFVYVIYAGKGEADGGASTTIWPHNWSVDGARQYGFCTYSATESKVNGLKINNYACSGELNGLDGSLNGVGTFCHEFGHVLGLPDLYDTDYGDNYENLLTPNEWDIMDGGSYNGNGHCPPNYDPWEKYFFGWLEPVNPGNTGSYGTLYANGTENYNVYQINKSGTLQSATTEGLCYYLENRQQSGWDKCLPAHGMVIWKINFKDDAWRNNVPNNTSTSGAPLWTVVCSSGTKVGAQNGKGNVFGGSNTTKTSWSGVNGKLVTDILETNGVITFTYMDGIIETKTITWMADGEVFATTETANGKLVLPDSLPTACEGRLFVGWTATADYQDETVSPAFVKAGSVASDSVYYAVYATGEGEGGESQTAYVIFKKADSNSTTERNDDSSIKSILVDESTGIASFSGTKVYAGTDGIKLGSSKATGSITMNLIEPISTNTIIVTAKQYGTDTGKLTVTVNGTTAFGDAQTPSSELGEMTFSVSEAIEIESVTITTDNKKRVYIRSVVIEGGAGRTYSNYSTTCEYAPMGIENGHSDDVQRTKIIRNGQLLILFNGKTYNAQGIVIQ